MHRALVIQLGEALSEAVEALRADHALRRDAGALDGLRLRTMIAAASGIGNLSRPGEVLREQLRGELQTHLTDLLRIAPGADGDFVFDVFLLLNLGEPMAANAATVVVDELLTLIDAEYGTIFPAHRRGAQRRLRMFPIAVLPATPDCVKDRPDAITDLRALHDTVVERQSRSDEREFPIDRIFVVDAITSRGIAPLQDLVTQVRLFSKWMLFGGVRRHAGVVTMLEAPRNDLFATFGCAACELDYALVREALSDQLARSAAEFLTGSADVSLPSAAELLPGSAADDDATCDRIRDELDELAPRVLDLDGPRSVGSLLALYEELTDRIEDLADSLRRDDGPRDAAEEPRGGEFAAATVVLDAVALTLGVTLWAVAFYVLALPIVASIVAGGLVALLGIALVHLLSGMSEEPSNLPEPTPASAARQTEDSRSRVETLAGTIDRRREQLRSLRESFEHLASNWDDLSGGAPTHEREPPASAFTMSLTSECLLELLYQRESDFSDAEQAARSYLDSRGDWSELLAGGASIDAASLSRFCHETFGGLASTPVFATSDARETVDDCLRAFLSRWSSGVSLFLEGETHKQFDPDGFCHEFRDTIFAPSHLHLPLRAYAEELGAPSHVEPMQSGLEDVFIVSVCTDIHSDAVAVLR